MNSDIFYKERNRKINKRTLQKTCLYVLCLALAFAFIFYIISEHVKAYSEYFFLARAQFESPLKPGVPEKPANMPHFEKLGLIKNSIYPLYGPDKKQQIGIGLAIDEQCIISVSNNREVYIKPDRGNDPIRLLPIYKASRISVFKTERKLNPVGIELFTDFNDIDIMDEVILFTKINDRYAFSPGIISSKYSFIDEDLLLETDIRFDAPPPGSILICSSGNIAGFSVYDIDGSIVFFIPANEIYSLRSALVKDFLESTALREDTYKGYKHMRPDREHMVKAGSRYAGVRAKFIVLRDDSRTTYLLSFYENDKSFIVPFNAKLVIESISGEKYIKPFAWSESNITGFVLPFGTINAVELNLDMKLTGPATFFIDFEDFKGKSQRTFL